MDLIGVNNSIVNMRKNSMRARIHVIRDLLKKIKELQQKKSKTDAQKAQNERKTSRLQSEVTIIKQLKKDEMAKFALTNTKKFIPEINPEKDADRMDKLLKQVRILCFKFSLNPLRFFLTRETDSKMKRAKS